MIKTNFCMLYLILFHFLTFLDIAYFFPTANDLGNDNFASIILVDGEAELVELSSKGAILKAFSPIKDYFTSSHTHNELIASHLEMYYVKEENRRWIRLFKYRSGIKMFDEDNVDFLRSLAVFSEKDPSFFIQITKSSSYEVESTSFHVGKIVSLLENFGISKNKIDIEIKNDRENQPYQYIKIRGIRRN